MQRLYKNKQGRIRIIELLLLIAIIVTCISILLPSSGRARETSAYHDRQLARKSDFVTETAYFKDAWLASAAPIREAAQQARLIIHNAAISLRVDDPRAAANRIATLSEKFNGYVVSRNVNERYDHGYDAEMLLRVDAKQLQQALAAIRDMGQLLGEEIGADDVTDQYVDLSARLDNLQRTEKELHALLTEAREHGAKEVMEVFRELSQVRGQIEQLQGQINLLDHRIAYAAIHVRLVPTAAAVKASVTGWSAGETFTGAVDTLFSGLRWLVDVAIIFVVAIVPIAAIIAVPIILIIFMVKRRWRMHRAV